MLNFCAFFLSYFIVHSASAANWYLDSTATGAETGTSWSTAWRSTTSVIWGNAGVKAGDTLYISGGQTTKIYGAGLAIAASGTALSPITIRVGQESGHNGVAQLPAISIGTQRYIVINGSRSPTFTPPKGVAYIEQMKPNIGIRLVNLTGPAIYANGAGGENNTIRYVEIGPIGSLSNIGDLHGIKLLNFTSLANWLIEYTWIHDIQNDGINLNSVNTNPESWDALTVRWCIIERTGDDGIQSVRNGFTLTNSVLQDHFPGLYNGHPDQLQLSGRSSRYIKIINNIMRNKGNSLIIGEQYVDEGGFLGPMVIAGNLFYNTTDWTMKDIQAYGATFSAWRENTAGSANSATWRDLYVLNNTVYYQRTEPFKIGRASPSGGTSSVWNLTFTGSAVRNNLLIDNSYHADKPIVLGISGGIVSTDPPNGLYYDQSSFPMTHNIVAGPNTRVSWGGTIYSTGDALSAATGMPGNTSLRPLLAALPSYDFRLTGNDTVARNKGYNLSSIATQFPEFATDLWGNARGADGTWDIGAHEFTSSEPQEKPRTPGNLRVQ